MSAPANISCIVNDDGEGPGIILGARAQGDWTRALNTFTRKEQELQTTEKTSRSGVPIQVLIDGPYGGCSVDLGLYETVLLFAGGSGATFTIGILDDIVGRCVRGRACCETTKRIEFGWCIRSFGTLPFPFIFLDAYTFDRSDRVVRSISDANRTESRQVRNPRPSYIHLRDLPL